MSQHPLIPAPTDEVARALWEHRDAHQTYRDGVFYTHCVCGQKFPGGTPDDADAMHMGHREARGQAAMPDADSSSPASVQHFIDTGRYLTHAEVAEDADVQL